jgi:hypothetical protein
MSLTKTSETLVENYVSIPKQQALEHIAYEFCSLDVAYTRYLTLKGRSQNANDYIELTSLHARVTFDFLSKTKIPKRPNSSMRDDIVAEDFGYGPVGLPIRNEIKGRIDKEVAHLSYSRCGKTSEGKIWPFEEFVPVILKEGRTFFRFILDTFPDRISADHLGEASIALEKLEKYK